jgi:two-component sensor histidine kinase
MTMPRTSPWLSFLLAGVLSVPLAGWGETLEELRRKLERERDADDRAKITVQLGEALLDDVAKAFKDGAVADGEKLLEEYVEAIRRAHEDLLNSGRDARRSPRGFKDLEIHLRRSHRELDELGHLLTFDERNPLEKAKEEIEDIREKLLDNLMRRDEEPS